MCGDASAIGAAPLTRRVVEIVQQCSPAKVLVVSEHSEPLVVELQERGLDVHPTAQSASDLEGTQLGLRFDVIVVGDDVVRGTEPYRLRPLMHFVAGHLLPAGVAVSCLRRDDVAAFDELFVDLELRRLEQSTLLGLIDDDSDVVIAVHQRSSRFNVHDMLFEARSSIRRVTPQELSTALAGDDPPIVVDTRTPTDRTRFGVIDEAIHVPRTVVEWHLDPANGYRHPALRSFDQSIVVICNGGYSSSLSAANLARIGFTNVADVIGGMAAWISAGLPTVAPTHSHLGY